MRVVLFQTAQKIDQIHFGEEAYWGFLTLSWLPILSQFSIKKNTEIEQQTQTKNAKQ